MHNNEHGQIKQSQNKQWKLNKTAAAAVVKHQTQVHSLQSWTSSAMTGVDHPAYLAHITGVAVHLGNALVSHL